MSQDHSDRIGVLETTQARHGERLVHVERTTDRTAVGVDKLLEQAARRGEPQSLRVIMGTLAATGGLISMIGAAAWWFVSVSPVVQQLDDRMTELDHPRIGRVPVLERKVDRLDGWQPKVSRAGR